MHGQVNLFFLTNACVRKPLVGAIGKRMPCFVLKLQIAREASLPFVKHTLQLFGLFLALASWMVRTWFLVHADTCRGSQLRSCMVVHVNFSIEFFK